MEEKLNLKSYKLSIEFEAVDIVDAETFIRNTTIKEWLEHLEEGVQLIQLGDRIEKGGDLDGSTLCDWCNMYFKGDGELERCNTCYKETR